MVDIILRRNLYEPFGSYGELIIDNQKFCDTVEREWANNAEAISCVPVGFYKCALKPTTKKVDSCGPSPEGENFAFELFNNEILRGRWGIKIHVANSPTQLLGCIALGREHYTGKYGERCVGKSTETCEKFYAMMRENDLDEFRLEIADSPDCVDTNF